MPNPSDIAIMLDDSELVRLVSSWPKIKDHADFQHIATVSNILPRNVGAVIERAKTHELIFDDGSVNEYAQKYINALVGAELKRLGGKK